MSNSLPRLPNQCVGCRSSAQWVNYFRQNRARLRPIPWDEGVAFTSTERVAVIRSIQVFQLGESGEGKHLLRVAERYAQRVGDQDYLEALKMFLAEEHRHADELGRVLDLTGESRLEKEWTDHVFRWLRHRAGLELMIIVLLTGEVMAQVYYAALRRATRSTVLVRLCEQILADEVAHVRFQSERLRLLRRGESRILSMLKTLFEKVLFAAACVVVWHGHRKVFRAANFSFRSFWRRAHAAFRRSLHLRDPRRYVKQTLLSRPRTARKPTATAAFPRPGQDVYS
ncbi:MAG: ferritin-like domain-containing protein [Pirellulales bacterium]